MYDEEGKDTDTEINLPGEDTLSMLPILLIEMNKFIGVRAVDPEEFDNRLAENPNSKYYLKFGDETLDWVSVVKKLTGDQV
jgi:hypothetical protein